MAVPKSPSPSSRRRWIWLALPLLLAGSAASGAPAGVRLFDRVADMTARRFWDSDLRGVDWPAARDRWRAKAAAATDEASLYAAMQGLLDTLDDSHTFVVPPSQQRKAKDAADSDAAAGFGLGFAPVRGGIEVADVTAGGPADRAGVEVGWRLLAIDGHPPDWTVSYGAGDRATFVFGDDDGRRREMPLLGEDLPDRPARRARMLPGGVLLLGFDGFDPGTDRWIAGEIATADPRALVLDLRGNDGGDSTTLDRVAGLFFARKRVVLRLIRRRETEETTIGAGRDTWAGPLVLLVGPASASAAEAFAALIAESGRGRIVGQRTAGKLTGASEHRLPGGGMLSIAEHDVRTPDGRRLEGVGLIPDTPVVPTLAERRGRLDPALDCAAAIALGRPCAAR